MEHTTHPTVGLRVKYMPTGGRRGAMAPTPRHKFEYGHVVAVNVERGTFTVAFENGGRVTANMLHFHA